MTGEAELPRKLSVLDSAAIVVGTVIGSAVFIVPSSVAQNLPTVPSFLGVWVFTGLLSFFGALAYAELGAMMPRTGGQYVFLRQAYGPLPAFLCLSSPWTSGCAAPSASSTSRAQTCRTQSHRSMGWSAR